MCCFQKEKSTEQIQIQIIIVSQHQVRAADTLMTAIPHFS